MTQIEFYVNFLFPASDNAQRRHLQSNLVYKV